MNRVKTRAEMAKFINRQLKEGVGDLDFIVKHNKVHYGKHELQQLMDFMYGEVAFRSDELLCGGCNEWKA